MKRLDALSGYEIGRVRLGVSPHAPYSVSGPLYRMVARLAQEGAHPIAVHIAESADEWALLQSASGGFADGWRARGIPLPPLPGRSPIAWLEEHGVLGPRTLCIHVVLATEEDLSRLSRRGAAIAHCPRSNAGHGHGAAPLAAILQHRIRVGLGTDSVASVAPLALLAEARAARELAPLDEAAALRLATLDGARALGLEAEIGSLTPGKWGDLAVFRLVGSVDAARLAGTLLTPGSSQVAATFLAGKEVWRSPA